MIESTSGIAPERSGPPHNGNNRATLVIAAAFILGLVLLLAFNWN